MAKNFVYLMHASEEECELTRQRLLEAGIESKFEDYAQNAFFRIYGADSIIGKKIMVPEDKLEEAKALLNIDAETEDAYSFSRSKKPLYRITKFIIVIFLIFLLLSYIVNFVISLKQFR